MPIPNYKQPFRDIDYLGEFNLLQAEKILIINALKKVQYISEAHKILCPEKKPLYSLTTFRRRVMRHNIKLI